MDNRSAKKAKRSKEVSVKGSVNANRTPNAEEVDHLLLFLMGQLRWQHGKLIGTFAEFDDECQRIDSAKGSSDVAALQPLMDTFFSRHAKGDKWVPFHAVLGHHETYIIQRIWSLKYLSGGERYALSCAFSGSRFPALFDETVMDPCFPPQLKDDGGEETTTAEQQQQQQQPTAEGRLILDNPSVAFARGGSVHKRFLAYRKRGGKLHTTAFSPRPVPAGACGDEYTFYILERTRTFFEMGKALYPRLDGLVAGTTTPTKQEAEAEAVVGGGGASSASASATSGEASGGAAGAEGGGGWEAVDLAMQETKWVGPTLSKMFLVSTHLCLPRLKLLDAGIEVGIGAQEAFKLLLPGIQPPKDFSMLSDRREVLLALHRHVVGGAAGSGGAGGDGGGLKPESAAAAATASAATASCMASLSGGVMDVREPRLRPMIAWCAARAREKFCGAAASEEGLQEEWESATLASTTTAPISTSSTPLSSSSLAASSASPTLLSSSSAASTPPTSLLGSGAVNPNSSYPPECFGDTLSILAFQVNLCEWRKFRNNVDKGRLATKANPRSFS